MNKKSILISIKEASKILNSSKGEVYNLIKNNKISSVKENQRTFVYLSEINEIKKEIQKLEWIPLKFKNKFLKWWKVIWKYKYLELLFLLIGISYQYFVTCPVIIIDDIKDIGQNPFDHEFIIKNSGSTTAKDLCLVFNTPYIKIESGSLIRPKEGHKPSWIDLSKISGVEIPPDQKYDFKLNSWVKIRRSLNIADAKFNLDIKFKDFLFLPHQESFSFRTFSENGKLIWKKVGPKDTW